MLEVAEKMEMIKKIVSGENDCRRLSHQNLYYFFYLFFLNCHVCTQTRICLGCHGTKKNKSNCGTEMEYMVFTVSLNIIINPHNRKKMYVCTYVRTTDRY